MKQLIGAALVFVLAGCAQGPSRPQILDSLIGAPETQVVRTLGVPNRSIDTGGGHRFLAYDQQRTDYIPFGPVFPWFYGGLFYPGFYPVSYPVYRACSTMLELADNRVLSWWLRGNSC